jgi:hypothetical protein
MPVGVSAYVALANVTLGSAANTITFSSISQSYRDLVIVITGATSGGADAVVARFNGDATSSVYSYVTMNGNGSSATSGAGAENFMFLMGNPAFFSSSTLGNIIFNIFDYATTDKHKSCLVRSNAPATATQAFATRWANTSAITSVALIAGSGNNFLTGSTFALYGIAS